jgi:hypothetical protein
MASLPVTTVRDDPKTSRILDVIRNPNALVDQLYDLGFRYAIDVTYWEQRYWTFQAYLLDRAASNYPEAIVYQGKNSEVVDIKILEESMTQSCVKARTNGLSWDFLDRTKTPTSST